MDKSLEKIETILTVFFFSDCHPCAVRVIFILPIFFFITFHRILLFLISCFLHFLSPLFFFLLVLFVFQGMIMAVVVLVFVVASRRLNRR